MIIVLFTSLSAFGIYLLYKNTINSSTIKVTFEEIYSNVNRMDLIKLEYIDDFEIKNDVNTHVLVIEINNQKKFLDSVNKISKAIMLSNIKKLGSPVIIPVPEFNEALEIVIEKIKNYKNCLT